MPRLDLEQYLKEEGGGDTEGQVGFPCRRDSGGNAGGLFQKAHLHFICLYPRPPPSLHFFKQVAVSMARQKPCLACKISWFLFSKKQSPETVQEGSKRERRLPQAGRSLPGLWVLEDQRQTLLSGDAQEGLPTLEREGCLGHLGIWEPGLGMGIMCSWEGDARRQTQRGHGSGTTGLSLSLAGTHCSPSPRT